LNDFAMKIIPFCCKQLVSSIELRPAFQTYSLLLLKPYCTHDKLGNLCNITSFGLDNRLEPFFMYTGWFYSEINISLGM